MEDISYRSEEDLRFLYIEKGLTQSEIADKLDTSTSTISRWMGRFDIETGNNKWGYSSYSEIDGIYDESKSFSEMAEGTEYTADQIRYKSTRHNLHNPQPKEEISYSDEELLEQIENTYSSHGFISKRLFEYLNDTAAESTIRDRFGSWLDGIRKSSVPIAENQLNASGAQSNDSDTQYSRPRGSSSLYKSVREEVLDRDGYQCLVCGASMDSNDIEMIHTHHIKPVSSFDDPNDSHTIDNLVTLCKTHHNEVHRNNIECPDPPQTN